MPASGNVSGFIVSPSFTHNSNNVSTYNVGNRLSFSGNWGYQSIGGGNVTSTVEYGNATATFRNASGDYFDVEFYLDSNSGHSRSVSSGTIKNLDDYDNYGAYSLSSLVIRTNSSNTYYNYNSSSVSAFLNPKPDGIFLSTDSKGETTQSIEEGVSYSFIVRKSITGGSGSFSYAITGISQTDIQQPLTGTLSFTNSLASLTITPRQDNKLESEKIKITIDTLSSEFSLTDVFTSPRVIGLAADTGRSDSDGVSTDSRLLVYVPLAGEGVVWEYSTNSGATWTRPTDQALIGANKYVDLPQGTYASGTILVRTYELSTGYQLQAKSTTSFTVDLTKPLAPNVALISDSGSSRVDNISNAGGLNVSGLEAGATWEYSFDDGSKWFSGIGSTVEVSGDGAKKMLLRQTDAAGNLSSTGSFSFIVDTSVSVPQLGLTNDSGISQIDRLTNIGVVSVSQLENGATWEYSLDGGSQWFKGAGNTFALNGDGTHNILVRQTDKAGNLSASQSFDFVIDTSPSPFPKLSLARDTGDSQVDRISSNGVVNVDALEEGASWEYSLDGGARWLKGVGNTLSVTEDGNKNILVRQSDMAGNLSPTGQLDFVLDSIGNSPRLVLSRDSGVSQVDRITNNGLVKVESLEKGSTWEYSLDGGSLWAKGDGDTLAVTEIGSKNILVRQTDAAGNLSQIAALDFILDSAVNVPQLRLVNDTGRSEIDRITNSGIIKIDALENGASWEWSFSGSTLWSKGTGNALTLTGDGVKNVLVRQVDVAGNTSSSASFQFELDTKAPPLAPVFINPGSAVSFISGYATAGNFVEISFSDLTYLVPTKANGYWELSNLNSPVSGKLSESSFGLNSFQARQVDTAGNRSDPTAAVFILMNNNIAPEVTSDAFSINENSEVGRTLGALTASDADGNSISYSITEGNIDVDRDGNAAFSINPVTGSISVNDSDDMDYEALKTFNLSVQVSDGAAQSSAVAVVNLINTNDRPVGGVFIAGEGRLGSTLTASNDLLDADGIGKITYTWESGLSILGTGSTYTLTRSDLGKEISVTASYTDGFGNRESVTSSRTAPIENGFKPTLQPDSFGNLALFGDDHHNVYVGNSDRDVIYGGGGDDQLYGDYGDDLLAGDHGDDRLYGGYGDDLLTGDDGNDELEGDQGNDTLQGGAGSDLLTGGTGKDWLLGGAGDDTLDGSSGADTMDGGEGNDVYFIDDPDDVVTDSGGALESDVVYLKFFQASRYVLGQGIDAGQIGDTTSLTTLEGNAGNNRLTGNSSANELIGGAGADSLIGGNGADTLYGGSGNDVVGGDAGDDLLIGGDGAGNDTYVGGEGTDTIKYSSAQAGITVDLSASMNQAYATSGNDAAGIGVDQLSGIENVIAGDFDDRLVGNGVDNIFAGGRGNDTIDGGSGTDTAAYSGNRSSYILKSTGGRVTVQAVGASDGVDTLSGIETLRFADTTVTLQPNSNPTGSLSIRGTLAQNTLLSAVTTIGDADGMGALNYQWFRDGSAVSGANAASYGLTQADVGKRIGLTVSYTDRKGYLESFTVTSAQTVANVNDLVEGSITITGAATEGTTLSATASITDVDGLGALRYQWLANGKAIAGATTSTLQLAQSHVGSAISVNVSYTDGGGIAESLTSIATARVANVNNAPTGAAVITGVVAENSTLTVNTSTITDGDGLGKFTLQWQRLVGSNWVNIAKANAATYKLVAADIGSQVRVGVSYVDLQKTAEVVYSTSTVAVANVNDRPVGVPTITGALVEGGTLTAAAKITDLDGLGAFSYRWEMLSGGSWRTVGTGVSYALSTDAMGKQVRLIVSYTDGQGTAEVVTSATSAAITTRVLSLTGTANADVLTGMSGADILNGNAGNDRLNGNGGADRLTGGAGADELRGGAGNDTFVYGSIADSSSKDGVDTIVDFMVGDKISLAAIDANPTVKGDQAFAFKATASANSVWTTYDGTNTFVYADATGDPTSYIIIKLTGQVNLTAADFIL